MSSEILLTGNALGGVKLRAPNVRNRGRLAQVVPIPHLPRDVASVAVRRRRLPAIDGRLPAGAAVLVPAAPQMVPPPTVSEMETDRIFRRRRVQDCPQAYI